MNSHFSKQNTQMASESMEWQTTALVIREIKIKTTMRFHFASTKMGIIQNVETKKYWQRCREIRILTLQVEMYNGVGVLENSFTVPQKVSC